MKQVLIIVAAFFAGLIGGVLGTSVILARERSHPEQVIRARSFELTDEAGQTVSFWGIDRSQNAVLAFGGHWPKAPAGRGGGHPPLPLDNPHNQRATIGVSGDSAFVDLRAADGESRMRLNLNGDDKPILWMADEHHQPRMWLGIEQSDTPGPRDVDWGLMFYPEVLRIGTRTTEVAGQTYVQGGIFVSKDKMKYP
jgi:hypothetical protein